MPAEICSRNSLCVSWSALTSSAVARSTGQSPSYLFRYADRHLAISRDIAALPSYNVAQCHGTRSGHRNPRSDSDRVETTNTLTFSSSVGGGASGHGPIVEPRGGLQRSRLSRGSLFRRKLLLYLLSYQLLDFARQRNGLFWAKGTCGAGCPAPLAAIRFSYARFKFSARRNQLTNKAQWVNRLGRK